MKHSTSMMILAITIMVSSMSNANDIAHYHHKNKIHHLSAKKIKKLIVAKQHKLRKHHHKYALSHHNHPSNLIVLKSGASGLKIKHKRLHKRHFAKKHFLNRRNINKHYYNLYNRY